MKKIILFALILASCSQSLQSPKDIPNFTEETISYCKEDFKNTYWGDCFTKEAINNIYFIAFYGENNVELLSKINISLIKAIEYNMDYNTANELYNSVLSDFKLILTAYNENNSNEMSYRRNQIKLKLIAVKKSLDNIKKFNK
jgi:hypothetical protein